jgi:hypothetical protein
MPSSPQPNFLIVGAAKAGTTSLWHWLRRHPQVFMPGLKSPSFFVHGYGMTDQEKYFSLFEAGRGKTCVGEASTAYLAAPESPQWIYDRLGRVKIIILLRNPVERAYSMYRWFAMEGYEPLESFEEALAQEDWRMASHSFRKSCLPTVHDYFYFHSGLYREQVERYLNVFGRDSVKICLFDELKNDPAAVCTDVCRFLEISPSHGPALGKQNISVLPRSIALQFRLRKMRIRTRYIFGIFGRAVTGWLALAMKINKARGGKKPLSPAVRAQLVERYRPSVEQLAELIGRDLSHWLK